VGFLKRGILPCDSKEIFGKLYLMGRGVLWGERSSPGLLQRPWTYFILGAALVLVSAFVFFTAHPAQPVKIDSHVADYQVETKNGKYYANHLKLTGDSTDYVFDGTEFSPSLPDSLQADAPIRVWVDRGTTKVLAIELGGQTYSRQAYRDPSFELEDNQHGAEAIAAAGAVLIGVGLLFRQLMKRDSHPGPPPRAGEGDFRPSRAREGDEPTPDVRDGRGRLVP
jgi:hypothetical protein